MVYDFVYIILLLFALISNLCKKRFIICLVRFILLNYTMKVKELIKELERYDGNLEVKLRVWYVKGKAEVFFDFRVSENDYSDDKPFVNIESEEDIDEFLINQHGCEPY